MSGALFSFGTTPTTRTPPSFTPTAEQQAVYDWVQHGHGSLFINAYAGTGKTSTAVECCSTIPMHESVYFTAFNKKIADEIGAKTSGLDNVRSSTFHSAGFSAWRRACRNGSSIQVDTNKTRKSCDQLKVPYNYQTAVCRLVSCAKTAGVMIPVHGFDPADIEEWDDLIEQFDILLSLEEKDTRNTPREVLVEALANYSTKLLNHARDIGGSVVDFDDMLWLPLVEGAQFYTNDWVLVDEAQDTSLARRLIASEMMGDGSRSIWVGDRYQCQPGYTKVAVITKRSSGRPSSRVEWKYIRDVRVGDYVVSYVPRDCAFRLGQGRRVNMVSSRVYPRQELVVVHAGNKASRYTPEHRCFVNFKKLRNKWCVYLMRKGRQYRIGKCRMEYVHSSGVSGRLHHEKADCAWILQVFDREQESFFREQAISGKFGIPQLMFSHHKLVRQSAPEYLTKAWGYIGDNSERGERCLREFGRLPDCPLFVRGDRKQQTIKRPIVTAAANLLDDCLVLPFEIGQGNHVKSSDWREITVTRERYSGNVYSLDVEGGLYVADGIVTHNSIYAFAGASVDAVDQIIRDFDCAELPLSTTFRCSKEATRFAQQWVPGITAHENNKDGAVYSMPGYKFWDSISNGTGPLPDSAILCRVTRPLVTLAFQLIREGVGCYVEGRDIGKRLDRLVSRWRTESLDQVTKHLEHYRAIETQRYMARDQPALIAYLNDQIDTLYAIMDGCETASQVRAKISKLFEDSNGSSGRGRLVLSTVHKAKGREWENVYILDMGRYMPSKWAKKDWEREQETNLMYVAATRTKGDLVLLDMGV